jgi:hypothetical protein
MRWPLRLRRVYVPVALQDTRPTDVRWNDRDYLAAASGFGGNGVYLCEVSDALRSCRAAADQAATPDELKGVQVGIRLLHHLLTMGDRAKAAQRVVEARGKVDSDEHSGMQLG